MKDFTQFDNPATRKQVAAQVLIKRGKYHVYGPNDAAEEKKVSEQVEVAFEALKKYHQWLSS